MKIEFIDVKYKGEVKLSAEAIKKLKKYKLVAVYTTAQFISQLNNIIKQLTEANIKVITSKPARANCIGQVLGCDVYSENLGFDKDEKVDAVLFIGDGKFHVNALLFAGVKEVINYNPLDKRMKVYNQDDIKKVKAKQKANLTKFYSSDVVGILISTKLGQEHPGYIGKLKEKYPDKKFYVFVCDSVDFRELENFPFVRCWVNTACPRIGLEDVLNTSFAVVNVCDVV